MFSINAVFRIRAATLAVMAAPLHRPFTNCGNKASPPLAHNLRIADGNCRGDDEEDVVIARIIAHTPLVEGSRSRLVISCFQSVEERIV